MLAGEHGVTDPFAVSERPVELLDEAPRRHSSYLGILCSQHCRLLSPLSREGLGVSGRDRLAGHVSRPAVR
jgi:hypothetical protein